MTLLAVDTETTGIDFYHGSKPFLVTVCKEGEVPVFWEWDVDPVTRKPIIPPGDIEELRQLILYSGYDLVLQNAKFDVTALTTLHPSFSQEWPWHRTKDTLIAGHLLASNQPHDLTSMAVTYLEVDISDHENILKDAVRLARAEARKLINSGMPWRLAKDGEPDMPSAGTEPWKNDLWLPRFLANYLEYEEDHPWRTVLQDYANVDSAVTLALWQAMEVYLDRRSLNKILQMRMASIPVALDMEQRGVTVCIKRMGEIYTEYRQDSDDCGAVCQNIAGSFDYKVPCEECVRRIKGDLNREEQGKGIPKNRKPCKVCGAARDEQERYIPRMVPYQLEMPKAASPNNSLRTFLFDVLKLPQLQGGKKSKTDAPTLNKEVMAYYLNELPRGSKSFAFIRSLAGKRSRDTALGYMDSYRRFWHPHISSVFGPPNDTIFLLHPSLNPTGTDTLRWSSERPNEQNISKQGMRCLMCLGAGCNNCDGEGTDKRNVRYCFGPPPGYEWWSLDAKNIELRIPAYASKEQELIALFERPDDPPYYGSTHLLNFHTIYKDIWDGELAAGVSLEKVGPHCKKKYAATYYQWCKNGGFAVQYGAVDPPGGGGTADRAFHRRGAHAMLKARFSRLEALNQRCIGLAERYGYIETMPDRTVDPARGYPLMCIRTERGRIKPTLPLNYYVQGTAMWWTMKAMIRTKPMLDQWTEEERKRTGKHYRIVMQVHDEMVFEMPARADPKKNPKASNLGRAKILAALMAQGGDDIGVPTPVGIEYHESDWCNGVTLA